MHLRSILILAALVAGCGSSDKPKADPDFHTSGSRDADQRAEQRISKDEQLRGKGGSHAEEKKDVKVPLYERLGGSEAITSVVGDFVDRMIADPRINFERKDMGRSGLLGMGSKPPEWKASPQAIKVLKVHLVEFVTLATGGPAKYTGKDIKASHAGMRITNAEFDAAIGDLKATLDNHQIATAEQKELLAIVESTRPQIVEVR